MDKIDYQNQYKGSSSFDLEIRTEYLKNQWITKFDFFGLHDYSCLHKVLNPVGNRVKYFYQKFS